MNGEENLIKISALMDGEMAPGPEAKAAGRLAAGSEAQRWIQNCRLLAEGVRKLEAPLMDGEMAEGLWRVISERVVQSGGTGSDEEEFDGRLFRVGEGDLSPSPEVGEEQWNEVWRRVREQTVGAGNSTVTGVVLPIEADFTPRNLLALEGAGKVQEKKSRLRRTLFSALGLAALLMLALGLIWFGWGGSGGGGTGGSWAEAPDVVDDRYFLLIKHVQGMEQPVVWFVLKDDPTDGKDKEP